MTSDSNEDSAVSSWIETPAVKPASSPFQNRNHDDDDLPSNVSDISQLASLPNECRSQNPTTDARPLRHVDDQGTESFYALHPLRYSVWMILLVELMERFSFYGIYYTQTSYLTGAYNEDWN